MYSRGGGSDAHRQVRDREPFDRGDSRNGSGRGGRGQGSYLSNRGQDQVRRGRQRQNGGDGYGRRSRSPPPPHNRHRPPSSSVRGLTHSPVRDRSVAHHSSKLDYYGPPPNEWRQDAYLHRRSYSHYGSHALGPTGHSSDASNRHRQSPQRYNGQVGLPSSSIVPASSSSQGRPKQQQEQAQQQQKSSITPPPGASSRNNSDGVGSGRPAPSFRGIDGQLLGSPFAGKSGVGKGAKGMPKKPRGDGSACAYLDPIESWRFADFEVTIETPKDSGEFRRYVGPLRWAGNGHTTLQTTLYDDDALHYGDSERTKQINVSVEVDEDILYLPPGGGDPMNLGTVESGSFEQHFQKPTPRVSIRGITLESNEVDLLKDALHEKLDDDENEVNIVECRRKTNGNFYVKFGLVHEAEGCEKMLDGQKLLGGRIGVKRVYKEKE